MVCKLVNVFEKVKSVILFANFNSVPSTVSAWFEIYISFNHVKSSISVVILPLKEFSIRSI